MYLTEQVGWMVAILLPIPLVLTSDMAPVEMVLAAGLPALANSAVGTIIEPMLFGASLNLSTTSILIALVFWNQVWGLSEAILSVHSSCVARWAYL